MCCREATVARVELADTKGVTSKVAGGKKPENSADEAESAFELEEATSHFNLGLRLRDSCYEW